MRLGPDVGGEWGGAGLFHMYLLSTYLVAGPVPGTGVQYEPADRSPCSGGWGGFMSGGGKQ